jgi:hypothetical protein
MAKLALKVCISQLIIIQIKKFLRFFLSTLYGIDEAKKPSHAAFPLIILCLLCSIGREGVAMRGGPAASTQVPWDCPGNNKHQLYSKMFIVNTLPFPNRVGSVLSFFSSRRNWDSPITSPPGEYAPPPFGSGGGAHSLPREGVGESQCLRGDIHCGTL